MIVSTTKSQERTEKTNSIELMLVAVRGHACWGTYSAGAVLAELDAVEAWEWEATAAASKGTRSSTNTWGDRGSSNFGAAPCGYGLEA